MHANLCMYILASTFQYGGKQFPVTSLPVLNSVTNSSQHTLLLLALHSQWSCQVYIIHRSITGFLAYNPLLGRHLLLKSGHLGRSQGCPLSLYSMPPTGNKFLLLIRLASPLPSIYQKKFQQLNTRDLLWYNLFLL